MRSCTRAATSEGAVVTMQQDSSGSPVAGSRQRSQRPARPTGCPSVKRRYQGCFSSPTRCHSYHPSASTRQRRRWKALRNEGFSVSVSARALIMRAPIDFSLAQDGTRPQYSIASSRGPPVSRTVATNWVGAMFQRGSTSGTAVTPNSRVTASWGSRRRSGRTWCQLDFILSDSMSASSGPRTEPARKFSALRETSVTRPAD